MKALIQTSKTLKNRSRVSSLPLSQKHFAFIGSGSHSLDNLYPVIFSLGIHLKYILSRDHKTARTLARLFPECTPVTDINVIVSDESITGVFVCTSADFLFDHTIACLQAKKYVFTEKPCVRTLDKLHSLIKADNDNRCMVALNKRFSPFRNVLKRKAENAISYTLKYLTGAYPEGDSVSELFIHPIDMVVDVFGAVKSQHIITARKNHILLGLQHQRTSGFLELSNAYSWNSFTDSISILTSNSTIEVSFPDKCVETELSSTFMSIPIEKIFKLPTSSKNFSASSAPVLHNNPVVLNGYYSEIHYFVKRASMAKPIENCSPKQLISTFKVLEEIRNCIES
jgi:virulence factor